MTESGGTEGRPVVPGTWNHLSGTFGGPVVQAQHIHGGITFQVPAEAWAPPARPDQVPAFPRWFRNRSAELSWLDGLLRREGGAPRAAAQAVIGGLPGMGKSVLAQRWAEAARDAFPDGQLYVDYAELRHGPGADVSEALARCLRSLGVPEERLPRTLAERAAELRTRTAGKRLLIVLDDVRAPAEVRPLLPKGPGSLLLVTSSQDLGELVLDGAELLALEPLGPESGLRLLADLCGAETIGSDRPAAERLVELSGGLPVALRVLGARLFRDRRLTPAALAAELGDEHRRLAGMSDGGEHSVSAVLGPAYRELPPGQARVYRLLGWFPGRAFDAAAAAAATGGTPEETGPLLDALTRASLLNPTADGRYAFHDLVRLHAREAAEREEAPEARAALVARVTAHYLALTALADLAIRADRLRIAEPGPLLDGVPDPFTGPGSPAPLDWLTAERDTILAVLREASRHGQHGLVWPLAEVFTVLFLHRREVRPWRESLLLGAESAAEAGHAAAEARLRSLLSRPLLDLCEDERARAELDRALERAEAAGRADLRASVAEFDGRYWDRHDPARAVDAYRRSRALNEEAGEARGMAIAAFFLGCAQDAAGDHPAARATLEEARAGLLARGDRRMAARAQAALGAVHEHLDEVDQAVSALREAAAALGEERAEHYEAETRVRLAKLLERTAGDPVAVWENVARARQVWERTGHQEAAAEMAAWLERL